MLIANEWKEYALLSAGGGEKLEQWGRYVLLRPDPQAIWPMKIAKDQRIDAHYCKEGGGGHWEFHKKLPETWTISYKSLRFLVRPTGFKHTGLFPEQAVNWDFAMERIQSHGGNPSILNLFGYTGGATVACASAGASVTHVDAAKGIVAWAKENMKINGLSEAPVRYIVDDALKFVKREQRRGRTYDGIIMDPPSYGRGPTGEMWKIEDSLYELVEQCGVLLSDHPAFFIVNSYTTGLAPGVLTSVLSLAIKKRLGGKVYADELGLPVKTGDIILPCGAVGRWIP